ncbi:WXG100-like domain-containing protein [Mycobacterium antarcticum]
MDAGAALVSGSRNVGFGVGMSATNYSQADAASTIGGGATPLTAPEKPPAFDTPPCPSSLGGGVMPPFLWSVLETFIPDSWPDGNPERLRASADAWQSFASELSGKSAELTAPSGIIGGQQIPESGKMTSAMSELSQSMSSVATEAGNLATQTREFADDVQSTQDAIRDLCDRISPSGFFDGITAVFSGDALDEIKEIADDVQKVLENFGRQVDGRISLMQTLITALDDAVVSLQQTARREFTHYLGDDVGGALASTFEFQSNVSEGALKAGLETIVGIQQLDPTRFASDSEGAAAAWGGVLDTLKYATPNGVAMDPTGAFEHGKDMLGGIVHSEDWRADRPGLGRGGVLFEAGSAATGIGAAKTGLRGVTAAADASEGSAAARAVVGAAEGTAPIAGRASEIAAKLDDLTTLSDDIGSGAAQGAHSSALPSSLADPDLPHAPEAPRLSETSTPQAVPDSIGPRSTSDAPPPRVPEAAAHVPDASAPRTAEVTPQTLPDASAAHAPESPSHSSRAAAAESPEPVLAPSHAGEALPPRAASEPAMVASGGGAHAPDVPASGSFPGLTEVRPIEPPTTASPLPETHSGAQHQVAPPTSHVDDVPTPTQDPEVFDPNTEKPHQSAPHHSDPDSDADDPPLRHPDVPQSGQYDLDSAHALELGTDPAIGGFRPAEAETGLRIEHELGITLERSPQGSSDWFDPMTGESYDAVGNFDGKHLKYQWEHLQASIVDHLEKADYVPVDVSRFSAAQKAMVEEFVRSLVTDRVFTVGGN